MAETPTAAFETTDLMAALLAEMEEIVSLIARPVGWPTRIPHPALAPRPAEIASGKAGSGWQGRVSPA